jgi:excisionase family DNA binding protein
VSALQEELREVVADFERRLPSMIEAAVGAALAKTPSLAASDLGLTVEQWAAREGMSVGAVRKAIARGTIPARRLGRRVRIHPQDVAKQLR